MNHTTRVRVKTITSTEYLLEIKLKPRVYEWLQFLFEGFEDESLAPFLDKELLRLTYKLAGYRIEIDLMFYAVDGAVIIKVFESDDPDDYTRITALDLTHSLTYYGPNNDSIIVKFIKDEDGIDTFDGMSEIEKLLDFNEFYYCSNCESDLREVGVFTEDVRIIYEFNPVNKKFEFNYAVTEDPTCELRCNECGAIVGNNHELLH